MAIARQKNVIYIYICFILYYLLFQSSSSVLFSFIINSQMEFKHLLWFGEGSEANRCWCFKVFHCVASDTIVNVVAAGPLPASSFISLLFYLSLLSQDSEVTKSFLWVFFVCPSSLMGYSYKIHKISIQYWFCWVCVCHETDH